MGKGAADQRLEQLAGFSLTEIHRLLRWAAGQGREQYRTGWDPYCPRVKECPPRLRKRLQAALLVAWRREGRKTDNHAVTPYPLRRNSAWRRRHEAVGFDPVEAYKLQAQTHGAVDHIRYYQGVLNRLALPDTRAPLTYWLPGRRV